MIITNSHKKSKLLLIFILTIDKNINIDTISLMKRYKITWPAGKTRIVLPIKETEHSIYTGPGTFSKNTMSWIVDPEVTIKEYKENDSRREERVGDSNS